MNISALSGHILFRGCILYIKSLSGGIMVKPEAKERIYLLVIIFSLLMCSAMIITMLSGEKPGITDEHVPVVRNIKDTENSYSKEVGSGDVNQPVTDADEKTQTSDLMPSASGKISISQDRINEKLEDFLPSGFPLKNCSINITDGMLQLEGETHREELIEYMQKKDKEGGLKYSAILMLLPEKLDIEAIFTVKNGTSGSAELKPQGFVLANREIGIDILPAKMIESLSKAVNKVISTAGEGYRFFALENGCVILEKI